MIDTRLDALPVSHGRLMRAFLTLPFSFGAIYFLLCNFHLCLCQEMENKIKKWCAEAGEDVSYEFLQVSI